MNEKDELMEEAILGRQVELFLQSEIGSYLIKHSEEEIARATEKLKHVASWRRRRIQELQNQIQVAEWFQVWLGEAVAAGQNAINILEEEDAYK